MGCLFTGGMFWGVLLIFLGLLLILKVLFNINIPVFRILFALLLIYLGIRILVDGAGWYRHAAPFNEAHMNVAAGSEYRIVFGKGVIDLSGIPVADETVRKELHTVFGSSTVKIDSRAPVKITVAAAFASARFPDGNVVSFGRYTYVSPAYREGAPCLSVEAQVVFGEMSLVDAVPRQAPG